MHAAKDRTDFRRATRADDSNGVTRFQFHASSGCGFALYSLKRRSFSHSTCARFPGLIRAESDSATCVPLLPPTFSAILFSCMSLALIGCGYDLVETKDLEKLKVAEAEVKRLREENSELRQQVATLKSIGRYQLHQSGFRTWRLDSSTGQDCLLLSSKEDWKKVDTVLESCPSQ
jgi:hypothetical protein